jgi:thymidylate synthase (FAD)
MNVELLDSMGNDLTVVNAARVSFAKVKHTLDYSDERLIAYLANHKHWSPFAHVMLQFRITAPIFIARQWYRHTVGFARNEVSRRYVSDAPSFWCPDEWRERAANVKQGSGGASPEQAAAFAALTEAHAVAARAYKTMLALGIAPEQARAVLPQSTYTQWVETASLYAYARLVNERKNPTAQKEISVLADLVGAQCQNVAPNSWRALCSNTS